MEARESRNVALQEFSEAPVPDDNLLQAKIDGNAICVGEAGRSKGHSASATNSPETNYTMQYIGDAADCDRIRKPFYGGDY